MFLNPSGCVLTGLLSFFFLSSALPFFPHPRKSQPESLLIPRASYSVVPVDGGAPTEGGSLGATITVLETITQTEATQTTLIVVSTDTVPIGTKTITVTGQGTTETSVTTLPPAVATVTVTAAGQYTVTIMPTAATGFTSAVVTSIAATSTSCTPKIISISNTTTTTSPPKSSKTYDDGFWHTTYPVWSNSSTATISHKRNQIAG